MALSYHGEYVSSTIGQTGCVKGFVSRGQGSVSFPPQVTYRCELCNKAHGFRLIRTHMVSTPTQVRRFHEHCERNHLEDEVELPTR